MNTMNKKTALCNQLNMNFEEANELFDNESLESMQMARVNGGSALLVIGAIVGIVAGLTTIAVGAKEIYSWYVEDDGSTPEAELTKEVNEWAKLNNCQVKTLKGDSLVLADGTKVYGFTLTVITPTVAQ